MKTLLAGLTAILLAATACGATALVRWSPAPAHERVTHYEVHERAGGAVAQVAATETSVQVHVPDGYHPTYTVTAVNAWGKGEPSDETPMGRLANLSTRGFVGTGDAVMIAGLVINRDGPTRILVRAVGPGLAPFLQGTLADPFLTIVALDGTEVATNDDWGGGEDLAAAMAQVHAFALAPDSKDAALLLTLNPGQYTVVVKGVGDTTGMALVECYEVP